MKPTIENNDVCTITSRKLLIIKGDTSYSRNLVGILLSSFWFSN